MRGEVDEAGRELLTLSVRPSSAGQASDLVVWVDTAFDGELVAPLDAIREMETLIVAEVFVPHRHLPGVGVGIPLISQQWSYGTTTI